MTFRFASLGSGSAGNATVVSHIENGRRRSILIDCGFSARETEKRLARLALGPADIDAILLTHEHADHAKGVAAFSRKHQIPVYMSQGTCMEGAFEGLLDLRFLRDELEIKVAGLVVKPVTVPHDAREPLQFVLRSGHKTLGVLTDLGSITPSVIAAYDGLNALLVEANHDSDMLARGPYPLSLQRRVGGDWGHLNNQQCLALLEQLNLSSLECLVVGHISQKNNSLERVSQCLQGVVRSLPKTLYACQEHGFDWVCV